jgi:hypothetical protein
MGRPGIYLIQTILASVLAGHYDERQPRWPTGWSADAIPAPTQ